MCGVPITSHGFVIVAPTPAFLSASDMTGALDWILAENRRAGSPYFAALDPDRVAMGGHSQGSTSTFDAEENETRLRTTEPGIMEAGRGAHVSTRQS